MTHWYKRSLRLKPPAHLQIEYLCSVLHSRPLTKPTNAEFYIALGWWPVKMAVPLVTWLRMSNFLETSNSHDKNETKNRVARKQLFSLLQAWSHKVQAYKVNVFATLLETHCCQVATTPLCNTLGRDVNKNRQHIFNITKRNLTLVRGHYKGTLRAWLPLQIHTNLNPIKAVASLQHFFFESSSTCALYN